MTRAQRRFLWWNGGGTALAMAMIVISRAAIFTGPGWVAIVACMAIFWAVALVRRYREAGRWDSN